MRTITLNPEQQRRARILEQLNVGKISTRQAADLLVISPRQVRRLKAAYATAGMESVIHKNRGRSPHNKTPSDLVERILPLVQPSGKYYDFDVAHMHELLAEQEQIHLGRSTLDRLLRKEGVRQRRHPRPSPHRRRRERMAQEGALVQIDGSPYAWLEERGPGMCCLIGAIDDATSKVLHLLFRPTEDQAGYLMLWRQIAVKFGLPMAFYHDRHTMLRSPKEPTIEEQLQKREPESQLQRVLRELGVESIPAYSPQAKGRVERLWGTLQRRLTREMRLANVRSLEEANAFLPAFIERFNARFAQQAQDPDPAWVTLSQELDLHYHFSLCELRTLKNDRTISFDGHTLQLLPSPHASSLLGHKVQVRISPEHEVRIYDSKATKLPYKPAPTPQPPSPKTPALALTTLLPKKANGRRKQTQWLFTGAGKDIKYPSTLTLETPSQIPGCFEGQCATTTVSVTP